MTSIFPAALVISLLCLGSVGTTLAATPVVDPAPATTSAEQNTPGKQPAPAKKAAAAKKNNATAKKRARAASKSKLSHEVAQTRLPPVQLDLSLPADMVRHLQPIGTMPAPKNLPLLPPMFEERPSDNSAFQINGRLLSNEMRLQLRNEERRNVEGAALDFEFKQ